MDLHELMLKKQTEVAQTFDEWLSLYSDEWLSPYSNEFLVFVDWKHLTTIAYDKMKELIK